MFSIGHVYASKSFDFDDNDPDERGVPVAVGALSRLLIALISGSEICASARYGRRVDTRVQRSTPTIVAVFVQPVTSG